VQLQTNFGGGKTHSILALYHLFSGTAPKELVGIDAVMKEAGVEKVPKARRAVLVGNKISPGNPVKKPDGTVVRTLWGRTRLATWRSRPAALLKPRRRLRALRPTTKKRRAPAIRCASL
jgi:predicted AAA+ superfamily ATPase